MLFVYYYTKEESGYFFFSCNFISDSFDQGYPVYSNCSHIHSFSHSVYIGGAAGSLKTLFHLESPSPCSLLRGHRRPENQKNQAEAGVTEAHSWWPGLSHRGSVNQFQCLHCRTQTHPNSAPCAHARSFPSPCRCAQPFSLQESPGDKF